MRTILFITILLVIPILFWTTDLIEDPPKQQSKKVETFIKTEHSVIEVVKYKDHKHKFIHTIKKCLDKIEEDMPKDKLIPTALIIAQAAHESGWGTSRFAKEAYNIFGIRTWDKNEKQIKARGNPDAKWGIKVFSDWRDCTAYYYDLLNRHPAYEGFRTARGMMLKFEEKADAITLAKFLTEFSELGQTYTRRIETTIHQLNEKYLDEHGNIKN